MKNKVHHSFFKLTFITMISLIFCFVFTISYSKYVLNANVGTLTLDANGETIIPEKAYLLPGLEFNAIISEKNPTKIIVGDYSKYANEVKDVRTTAIAVDVDQSGVINLYMVDDVAYILSKTQIYANQDSSGLFGIGVDLAFGDDISTYELYTQMENIKLKSIILENFNTSEVENMAMMFFNLWVEEIQGLDKLDTHLVETMEGMFYSGSGLVDDSNPIKGLEDLSNFDTRNVTNMANMFAGVKVDYPLDLSFFDTSHVETMEFMFEFASFPSLDVSTWNTENVTNMNCMFEGILVEELDLSSFDTHNVTNMYDMFGEVARATTLKDGILTEYFEASPLKTVYVDSTKWSTENLSSKTTRIFSGLYPFLVGEKGTAYQYSNQACYSSYDGPLTNNWVRARVDGYEGLPGYFTEKGHTPYVEEDKRAVLNKRVDFVPLVNIRSYGDWGGSFSGSRYLNHIVFGKYNEIFPQIKEKMTRFDNYYYDENGDFTWYYAYDVDTYGGEYGKNIIPIYVSDVVFDENHVEQYYEGTLYLLSKYDTPIYAPEDCSNLFAYSMFDEQYDGTTNYGTTLRLQTIDFNHCFDTSNTTNMRAMFANPSLQEIKGLDTINTTHVTDMSGMFLNARNLKNLDLSHFDTSNVEHMNAMFGNIGLEELDLSSFDTHKVQSMENMFGWTCENLLEVEYDVDSTHYKNVTIHDDYLLNIKPYSQTDFNMIMSDTGYGKYSDTSSAPLKTIFVDKEKWSTEAIVNKETEQIWYGRFNNLMGGAGTQFNAKVVFEGDPLRTATYACIDGNGNSGYLTEKIA